MFYKDRERLKLIFWPVRGEFAYQALLIEVVGSEKLVMLLSLASFVQDVTWFPRTFSLFLRLRRLLRLKLIRQPPAHALVICVVPSSLVLFHALRALPWLLLR